MMNTCLFSEGFLPLTLRDEGSKLQGILGPLEIYLKRKLRRKLKRKQKRNQGTCARGAKRPRVGRFTRCLFVFALIYVEIYVFFISGGPNLPWSLLPSSRRVIPE